MTLFRNHYRGKATKRKRRPNWKRWLLWGAAAVLAILVVANAVMWLAYRERVLPNVSLGAVAVGGVPLDELDVRIESSQLLPQEVELHAEDESEMATPAELGISVDWQVSRERLESQRSWFPLLNLLVSRTVPVELDVNERIFDLAREELAQAFHKNPLPERVVFDGDDFAVAAPETGYQMDKANFKAQILSTLQTGAGFLTVPTQTIDAPELTGGLEEARQKLSEKLDVSIKFNLGGEITQLSRADIGSWFEANGSSMQYSPAIAQKYVRGIASPVIINVSDAASAAGYALDNLQDINFVLATDQTPVKYTYCAQLKGVDASHRTEFIRKATAVLGDPRGWNAGGQVAFQRVDQNCDFDLWLSAPGQMTSFGGLCDPYWSCRSGRNVVINFDRWQGATDAWNDAGGGLDDYRSMVTNHEVGHWLGFGHLGCPGPGQPAPVMMQQSMDLRGCQFNPWPVESELDTLKRARGLAALPPRQEETLPAEHCCCARCHNNA